VVKFEVKYWGLEFDLPPGWSPPGVLRRQLSPGRYAHQNTQPEFYGPGDASIKFAIGPISPVPSVSQQQVNLKTIAQKSGHEVIEIGTISAGGKNHATIMCKIPGVGLLKHYSVIFETTEYLVTARGDWPQCDSIVKSIKVDQRGLLKT
jgi:hypothetical protein